MPRDSGRKKSNFPAKTVIESGAFFDYVFGGVNFKILDSDFFTALGVTGTIVPAGDPTGTPILDPQGTVNNIRTVEDGPGFKSSVSALNGIKMEHNFSEDIVGQKLFTDLTVPSPVARSLLAGAGMSITVDGNVITFAATGTAVPSTKIVTVNQLSDFPTPVSGVITLEAGTVYLIANNISTANRFVLQEATSVVGQSLFAPTLIYTGTDTMFTALDANVYFSTLSIICATGKVWDISETAPGGTKIFVRTDVIVFACDSVGDFSSLRTIDFTNSSELTVTTQGIVLSGTTWDLISFTKYAGVSTAAVKFIDLGAATANAIELRDLAFLGTNAGAFGVSGLAASGNLNTGALGQITGAAFTGGMGTIENILPSDVRWVLEANQGVQDTVVDAMASTVANATETVIAVAGTAVKLNATFTVDRDSKFTVDTTGRCTYIGERGVVVPVDIVATLRSASGTNKDISLYLALNGSTIAGSVKSNKVGVTDPRIISVIWQLLLSENDFLEVWVANDTDTINLVGVDVVIRVV